MKKLILILSIVFVAFSMNAQTAPTAVTPDAYISSATYNVVWGTTADTMTNADTLNFVYRIKGSNVMNISVGLYNTFVSGTASATLILYKSLDGVNYISTGDTITVTSLAASAFNPTVISLANYNFPYLKLAYLQTGTGVEIPKAYIYAKY